MAYYSITYMNVNGYRLRYTVVGREDGPASTYTEAAEMGVGCREAPGLGSVDPIAIVEVLL